MAEVEREPGRAARRGPGSADPLVRQPAARHCAREASTPQLITGGRSNLTYRLSDDHQQWALRRPPLGHVLPTAHDMAREFTVISALHGSSVPVPEPVALCEDRDVLGEPFYLMSFVDGIVVERPELVPDPATATRITEQLVDTLVALHGIDPDRGRAGRTSAVRTATCSARWPAGTGSSRPRCRTATSRSSRSSSALQADIPRPATAGIVHGDYRLTNVLFDRQLTGIEAVVDWEMATLGDPLTDLGLLYVYHERAANTDSVMPNFPSEQGFLSPEQMIARYAERSGQQLAELDWYIAFGYFKLGVIAAGIHARYLQGLTVGAGFEVFGTLRDSTLAAAADPTERDGS